MFPKKINPLPLSIIIAAFLLTLSISLKYPVPTGSDIHFHIWIAQEWAKGRNGMFSEIAFSHNHMPYPPLFHWLLVPSIWVGAEFTFARALQVVIYPTAILTSFLLLRNYMDCEKVFYGGLLMLGSLAFYDSLIQPIPQGIDVILFPLAVRAFLNKKLRPFILTSALMVWNHGLVPMVLLGGVLLYALLERRFKEIIGVAIATLPVIAPSLYYLGAGLNRFTQTNFWQERDFWSNPSLFTFNYIGPVLVAIPFVIWEAYNWRNLRPPKKIYLLTILCLLVMFPLWPVRCMQLLSVPLIYLASYHMDKRWMLPLAPIIILNAMLPWKWLTLNGYYVRGIWE